MQEGCVLKGNTKQKMQSEKSLMEINEDVLADSIFMRCGLKFIYVSNVQAGNSSVDIIEDIDFVTWMK